MKVVSSDALTKLIQLIKGSFIPSTNVESVSETTLATVATSGSYNDLSDKPTIPTTTSSVTSGSTAALTSGGAYTALQSYQTTANLVTSVSSSSTDSQYPSAKLFYDTCGDIETLLDLIIAQSVTRNTLTFNLTGDVEGLRVLTVNGTDYTSSNFTNNSLTLTFAQGTSIAWSVTKYQYYGVSPSSGSLTLNSDTTVTITLNLVE